MTRWKKPKASEHQEQVALFDWARMMQANIPELWLLAALPNGGLRDKRVAARLQKEGLKPGLPDIVLPVPRSNLCGLWIEMKVRPNRLTPAQTLWMSRLQDQGYRAVVCYGCDEAIDAIMDYLGLLRPMRSR